MNNLYIGVSKKNITPEVGCSLYGYKPDIFSEKIHDCLEAVAFVFKKDGLKCALVSATVCLIKDNICDDIKKEISEKTDIPCNNIMICATHTHTGPSTDGSEESGWGNYDREYVDKIFTPQIVAAVIEANRNLVPAKLGIGVGESLVGINRRELDENNNIKLGQCPWGPFNTKMTVLSFKNYDGVVVGNIIHYGCHATAGGRIHEISRDWPGVMTDRLEEISGGITAFINGPEGDVGPRITNGKTVGDHTKYIEEHGEVAAADAVRIFNTIKAYNDADLSVCSATLNIPVKPRMSIEKAQQTLEQFEKKYANFKINLGKLSIDFCKNTLKSYVEGYEDIKTRETDVTAIRIGNIALVGYKFELFSEIGMRLQKLVKNCLFLPVTNTNGTAGYYPTESELVRGGYEVDYFKYFNIQPFIDSADFELIKATLTNLENILK